MFTQRVRSLILVLILALSLAPLTVAAEGVTYTVLVKSVFGRSGPGFDGTARLASLFKGQAFPVVGRTSDSAWVQVDLGGSPGFVWVLAEYGTFAGDLATVPVTAEAQTPAQAAPAASSVDNLAGTAAPAGGAGVVYPPTKVKFTITAKAVYVRSGPSTSATPVASAFQNQSFFIRARTADSAWLQIDFAGAPGEAWMRADVGTVKGNLESVPIAGVQPVAPPTASDTAITSAAAPGGPDNPLGFSSTSLAYARAIARTGRRLGVNAHAFSRVGDSNTEGSSFLSDFDGGAYDLGDYGYLQDALSFFSGSFRRTGAAVQGFTSWGVTNPIYADPRICGAKESALVCELRLNKPGVALIMIGTNDVWVQGSTPSEPYFRKMVQDCIDRGVIPILSTLAWNPNSSYYQSALTVNAVIRKVAGDMKVPLWDFYQSTQALPGQGIGDYSWDPHAHLSSEPGGQPYTLRDPYIQAGLTRHNLEALQALYTVWKYALGQ